MGTSRKRKCKWCDSEIEDPETQVCRARDGDLCEPVLKRVPPKKCKRCGVPVKPPGIHTCAAATPNNVVSIRSIPRRRIFTSLDVHGRRPVHDRMVGITDVMTVSLLGPGRDSDDWELEPAQAEHLGMALIQAAAQCRIESGDNRDD